MALTEFQRANIKNDLILKDNVVDGDTGELLDWDGLGGDETLVQLAEGAAPATPAAGKVRIYAKTDGRIYSKDDQGTEYGPFDVGGAGGSDYIATITAHPDIVQYWPINEGAGATSYNDVIGGTDLSISGGVLTGGPSLTHDLAGGSAWCTGTGGFLSRSAITWPAQWTIECWMFIETLPDDSALIGQWNGSGAMLHTNNGNELRLYVGGANSTWSPGAGALRGLRHIAITYDGTNARLIFDGVERLDDARTAPSGTAGGEFAIGRYSAGNGDAGQLMLVSDVAIYDSALSEADCLAHYELGMGL